MGDAGIGVIGLVTGSPGVFSLSKPSVGYHVVEVGGNKVNEIEAYQSSTPSCPLSDLILSDANSLNIELQYLGRAEKIYRPLQTRNDNDVKEQGARNRGRRGIYSDLVPAYSPFLHRFAQSSLALDLARRTLFGAAAGYRFLMSEKRTKGGGDPPSAVRFYPPTRPQHAPPSFPHAPSRKLSCYQSRKRVGRSFGG
ncbi:hypothetical protein ARMSODRAFT_156010 [Armillaria solidipes]|uniref:PDZ domain-containing protein n=1 Tax=Armillaria solidipes TaxID=1076256 RepID=A0A2H3AWV2_9AGAR|nr:hypothetical protein ARMSODRAFT_156010 [Armillaria solidipes]